MTLSSYFLLAFSAADISLGFGESAPMALQVCARSASGLFFASSCNKEIYEMRRGVEVASDGCTKGARGATGGSGREAGVQSRGRRAIIRASGTRRLRLTFHSAPA